MTTGTFHFGGHTFPYLDAPYNATRITERAVEVPIALHLLGEHERPLEVGAVTPHYLPFWPDAGHSVIDLHEQFPGVTNADVLTWEPAHLYDLILCISTLDHLKSREEVLLAVRRMKSWLVPAGALYCTLPAVQPPAIGGGPWLDALVLQNQLEMATYRFDKVDPLGHDWRQVSLSLPRRPYNGATAYANTVYLLFWHKPRIQQIRGKKVGA